jgi:hypothetical protein
MQFKKTDFRLQQTETEQVDFTLCRLFKLGFLPEKLSRAVPEAVVRTQNQQKAAKRPDVPQKVLFR